MSKLQLGGWALVDNMPTADLPQEVATAWTEVMALQGATYIPVLYVGTQLVTGRNHMILCRQNLMVEGGESHLVKVILNCSFSNEWSIVLIETIA